MRAYGRCARNLALILAFRRYRKRKKVDREHWVHPINQERPTKGEFHLIPDLRKYPKRFKGYFRMSVEEFDTLLVKVRPYIERENTQMRKCISAEKRPILTLR